MTSKYEDIYSKFLAKITDYEFLTITDQEAYDNMGEWLRETYSRPKVRKLFSSIKLDNEIMTLEYELNRSIDDDYDQYFVEQMMASGMVVAWVKPKLQKSTLLNQMFAGKEQQFFSQSSHMDKLQQLYEKCESELDKTYIRDHGYSSFVIKGGNE